MENQVDHPQHYGGEENPYECIKVLENTLTKDEFIGFLKGNVMKYLYRMENKGNCLQDLEKAEWYLKRLHAFEEAKLANEIHEDMKHFMKEQ